MYFDGTYKKLQKPTSSAPLSASPASGSSRTTPNAVPSHPILPLVQRKMPNARYIGAFGVEGWATRSSNNLLKPGDVVKIERQKTQQTPLKMRLAAAGKSDVIVRFTDAKGTEIGRLAKDAANWISSLIDQNVTLGIFEASSRLKHPIAEFPRSLENKVFENVGTRPFQEFPRLRRVRAG